MAFVWILMCFLLVGVGVPVSKDAVATIPVWLFMLLTLAIGCVVMVPAAKWVDRTKFTRIGWRVAGGVFMQALLGAVLYTLFILYGVTYASALTAGILGSITPAVTLVLSFFLLHERLSLRKLVAIALAVVAVALVSTVGVDTQAGPSNAWGVVFMLLSALSVSLFFIYAKTFAVELPPTTMTAGICVAGLLMSLPMGVAQAVHFDWRAVPASTWWETVYYGIFVWALPFLFTFIGIPHVPASTVGMATAVTPLATTATAVVLFGEHLRGVDLLGLVLVVASIFIAEYRRSAPSR